MSKKIYKYNNPTPIDIQQEYPKINKNMIKSEIFLIKTFNSETFYEKYVYM